MFAAVLTVHKDEDLKKAVLDNFKKMLEWCENVLRNVVRDL